jgi:predicted RNA-binding Zn-ribbon protein involved in translation (DUF1610 family)
MVKECVANERFVVLRRPHCRKCGKKIEVGETYYRKIKPSPVTYFCPKCTFVE